MSSNLLGNSYVNSIDIPVTGCGRSVLACNFHFEQSQSNLSNETSKAQNSLRKENLEMSPSTIFSPYLTCVSARDLSNSRPLLEEETYF